MYGKDKMDIKILKFVSGEEIIAQTERNESVYTLKNPIRFMMTADGVAMMPWCPFSKNESFEINDCHIMFTGEPELEFRNAYNEKYGSGIITASASDLRVIDPSDI